jgi:uncharacterized membrane protein
MRGSDRTEFLALPIIAGLLGAIFLVLAAASVGGWAWVFGGVLILVGIAFGIRAVRKSEVDTAGGEVLDSRLRHDPAVYCVLVVADGDCSPEALRSIVEEHAGGRSVDAFVVAPAQSSRLDRLTGDEGAYERASGNLDSALHALATATTNPRGKLGSHDPVQAIAEALREFAADEILVPDEVDDAVVARMRFGIPISRVVAASR